MWNEFRFALASLLMATALLTLFSGVLGVFRFQDSLQRIHAASVNDSLGLFLAMSSLALAEGWSFTSLKFFLVLVLLWIASPVSSHLIARLEVHSYPKHSPKGDGA